MAAIITTNPFHSKYGFDSPGFSVDTEGNISVKSITSVVPIAGDSGTEEIQTFTVTDSGGTFEIDSNGQNPTITLQKTKTYKFDISLTGAFTWSIRTALGVDISTGIKFTDRAGTVYTGTDAHNRADGIMEWTVPSNTAAGVYYSNITGSIRGDITLTEPTITGEGVFTTLLVTGASELRDDLDVNANANVSGILTLENTTQSTTPSTGGTLALGGVGIAKNLNVGGTIKGPTLTATTKVDTPLISYVESIDFEVGADDSTTGSQLRFAVDGNNKLTISATGISANIVNSNIDNTVIGATTPVAGTFTTATVNNNPTNNAHATRKDYVDTEINKAINNDALAYSIAFGV